MKRQAGGLAELLIAFLILSLVVAYSMQTALMQMKSKKSDSQNVEKVKQEESKLNSVHFKKGPEPAPVSKTNSYHYKKQADVQTVTRDNADFKIDINALPTSNIEIVNDVILQVETAKKLKHEEEQKVIDSWTR